MNYLEIPVAASAHAGEIDRMTVLTHWLMAILFVGWGAFFIYTLVRFRQGANPKANYHGVKSHMASYIEWAVAGIELVLIVAFAIPAWAARVDAFPAESEATVVRVVAEQFAWNVHYPGADGQFGRTDIKLVSADNPLGLDRSDPAAKDDFNSINQLALPVNKPVIIHLSSKDVIHSFSLIQMRVKQDTIPGESIPVWFTPTMTGDWEINCSQLCGLGHYRMRGFYSIKTQADYEAWLKETAASGAGAVSEEANNEERDRITSTSEGPVPMGAGLFFSMTRIKTIDAEVAGEAVRLIVERRAVGARANDGREAELAAQERRELRRLLMLEPRGHAGMHGAMLTEPVSPGSHAGLLSMHAAGFPLVSGEASSPPSRSRSSTS